MLCVSVGDGLGGPRGLGLPLPAIYPPIDNPGARHRSANAPPAIAAGAGDDVVNNGTILTTGLRSPGIRSDSYGVITNNGTITVTGAGSAAVEPNGLFGTLLNTGSIIAAPGADAIRTGASALGDREWRYDRRSRRDPRRGPCLPREPWLARDPGAPPAERAFD